LNLKRINGIQENYLTAILKYNQSFFTRLPWEKLMLTLSITRNFQRDKNINIMKSLYILFTILFLAIATVSCGNKAKEEAAIVEEQATLLPMRLHLLFNSTRLPISNWQTLHQWR
jgi:hypothetical protein